MTAYEFHTLDTGSLRIATHSADCADDHDATTKARGILSAGGLAEIWAGPRRVTTLSEPALHTTGTAHERDLPMTGNAVSSFARENPPDTDGPTPAIDRSRPTTYPPKQPAVVRSDEQKREPTSEV